MISGVDPALIQSIGTFFGGIATFGIFIGGLVNRSKISGFLTDRFILVEQANDYRKRADAAERLAHDYAQSVTAMRITMGEFEKRISRLESIETKFALLVKWAVKIIEYVVYLERRAIAGGIDLSETTMPPVPKELLDDLMPEDRR